LSVIFFTSTLLRAFELKAQNLQEGLKQFFSFNLQLLVLSAICFASNPLGTSLLGALRQKLGAKQQNLHLTFHGTLELCIQGLHERPSKIFFCLASNFQH
jgi:hypothetical protein